MRPKSTGENSALPGTVQEAIYATVHQTDSRPAKAIAQDANMPLSLLYEIADEHRQRRLRAEEIPALVRATNNFVILDVLEAAVGRVAFRLPALTAASRDDVVMARDAIREFSEAIDAFVASTDDGRISTAEARTIHCQADEAIAAIARIKASLNDRVMPEAGAR